MAEDIKSALYATLGRKKLGVPQYSTQEEKRAGRSRFKCELRVPGINYTGLGASTSKKDAMTNAARDYGLYLIREGYIQSQELPQLSVILLFNFKTKQMWGCLMSGCSSICEFLRENLTRRELTCQCVVCKMKIHKMELILAKTLILIVLNSFKGLE